MTIKFIFSFYVFFPFHARPWSRVELLLLQHHEWCRAAGPQRKPCMETFEQMKNRQAGTAVHLRCCTGGSTQMCSFLIFQLASFQTCKCVYVDECQRVSNGNLLTALLRTLHFHNDASWSNSAQVFHMHISSQKITWWRNFIFWRYRLTGKTCGPKFCRCNQNKGPCFDCGKCWPLK